MSSPTHGHLSRKLTMTPSIICNGRYDGLWEGRIWLTSDASSHHEVASNWSFSTHCQSHNTCVNSTRSQLSLAPKSSYWFHAPSSPDPSIPPVQPLPSPYHSPTCVITEDPDPFHCNVPALVLTPKAPHGVSVVFPSNSTWWKRHRHPCWAAPPHGISSCHSVYCAGTQWHGYTADLEKGITVLTIDDPGVDMSYAKYILWLLSIWIPVVCKFTRLWSSLYWREFLQGLTFSW